MIADQLEAFENLKGGESKGSEAEKWGSAGENRGRRIEIEE